MNVLFTDIDGVLNRGGAFRGRSLEPGSLAPDLVHRLVQITANVDRVVITSMWRLFREREEISSYFEQHGYAGPDLEVLDADDRIHGILEWVAVNAPVSWVVLDDCFLAGMEGHQVLVTPAIGLSDTDVQAALHVLGLR